MWTSFESRIWTWICGSISNSRTLPARSRLELKRLDPRSTQLVLDTKGLMILDVRQKATDVLGATAKNQTTWVSRPFHLEKPDPILGSALVIELPPSKKAHRIHQDRLRNHGCLIRAAVADG